MLLRHRRPNELPTSLFFHLRRRRRLSVSPSSPTHVWGRKGGGAKYRTDPFAAGARSIICLSFHSRRLPRPCHPHAVKGRKRGRRGKIVASPGPALFVSEKKRKKIIAWCQTVSPERGWGVNEECQLKEEQEQDVLIDLRRLGVNSVHFLEVSSGLVGKNIAN